jgi:hypothetical protein
MPLALCNKTNKQINSLNYPYFIHNQKIKDVQPNKNLQTLREQSSANRENLKLTKNIYCDGIEMSSTGYGIIDKK